MALSSQNFIFNLDKSFNSFQLYAKQNDSTGARSFIFNVFQNGKPFNLTGVTASVGGKKPDSKEVFNNVNILDTKNGEIEVPLSTQMLVVAGTLNLELIFFKDSARLSSYPFSISIVPNVTNLSSVQSTDEFNALSDAMGRVNSSIDNMNNKTNQAVADLKSNKIGGTNLLNASQFFDVDWRELGTACTIDRTNLFEGCAVLISTYDWTFYGQDFNYYEIGKQYTISCYAKSKNGIAQISFSVDSDKTAWQQTATTTEWKKYSMTFTATQPTGYVRVENNGTKDGADKFYVSKIKLEKGVVATDWCLSPFDLTALKTKQELDIGFTNGNVSTNTKQIASNSSSISDIKTNWVSDCSNSLCINGLTSLKVYAQGVYYITGNSVTELQSIDHSAIKNGQSIYFICETNDQAANIKFPASLSSSAIYTPKGQDFWLTGRDNGDMIYRMQKMGGAMRFLA